MSRWLALVAFLVAACSHASGAPVAHQTASPSAEQVSTLPANSTPSAGPTAPATAVPDLPVSIVPFSCRLPIYKQDALTVDSFISFPSGDVTIDPNGNNGKYFDRAFSRWLPVPRTAVASDGAHYATVEIGPSGEVLVHVVDVASGQVRVFKESQAQFNGQPLVLDYSTDGIYLVNAFEHLLAGLWLVNPADGSIRQVSKDIYPVLSAGNGILWSEIVNPADPKPVVTGTSIGTLPNEIDRVDLRSGAKTVWLYEPGKGLGVIGLDSRGLPLIEETGAWGADPNARLLLVAAPDAPTQIFKGVVAQELGEGVTDAHGTWLSGQGGIYLYTNAGALEKVSNHPGYPANGCF